MDHERGNAAVQSTQPRSSIRGDIPMAYANVEDERAYQRAWYEANRDKEIARTKAYRQANPDKVRASNRAWHEANPDKARALSRAWKQANPEKHRASSRAHYARNKECYILRAIERGRVVTKQKPAWNDRAKMLAIYAECSKRNELAGYIKWHVDHIIPLRGKNVWGLHVHTNLQVIPAKENIAKSNKYDA